MKTYKHITDWDRWQIYALLREWRSNEYIWSLLWFDRTTIWKEIKRNNNDGRYEPIFAQREYEYRRSKINKWRNKLKNNPEMIEEIKTRMVADRWAPHSISGFKKIQWESFVCTSTIFKYINEREPSLKQYLKYKRWYKKRWKAETRGKPKENYRTIDERPIIVNERERIWDMEIDTIHSWWSERKWWMVTIVDRKTKFLAWWWVKQRTAKLVWDILIREMKKIPKEKLLTITTDNGKEFYDFKRVETALKVFLYFAHTYASYERWTNEQTNGMLRVFFPKWTDFSKISEEEIQKAIKIINRKPRKSLNYLCAEEAFYWIKLNL